MASEQEPHYVLYIFPFSLYSIMVRFTIALGNTYHKTSRVPVVENRLVNLHDDEEMTEWYLKINPKGQVPAMTANVLASPMPDSLDMSYHFVEQYYPGLLPEVHREIIQDLLSRVHAIEGSSLTIKEPRQELTVEVPNPGLDVLLARTDISDEYRRALEYKKSFYKSGLGIALRPESVAWAKRQANDLFQAVLAQYNVHSQGSLWIFGDLIGPTVIDAHFASFVARMIDARQEELVPTELLDYARRVIALPEWTEVMHGRSTMWNKSYGHVRDLQDF